MLIDEFPGLNRPTEVRVQQVNSHLASGGWVGHWGHQKTAFRSLPADRWAVGLAPAGSFARRSKFYAARNLTPGFNHNS
jgi:hypothetical protein